MTNKLIELVANKQFNEAATEFNSQIEEIAEKKIFEMKKMIAAKAFFSEGEQIDEISRGKISDYLRKADDDVRAKSRKTVVGGTPAEKREFYKKNDAKIDNRLKHMGRARYKLKEDQEQIDEISNAKLEPYIKKASKEVIDNPGAPKAQKRATYLKKAVGGVQKNIDAEDDKSIQAHKDKIKAVDDWALEKVKKLGAYQGSPEGRAEMKNKLATLRAKQGGKAWADWQAKHPPGSRTAKK